MISFPHSMKTPCSLPDGSTNLAIGVLSAPSCFDGYRVIGVGDTETPAEDSLRMNDAAKRPKGHPVAKARAKTAESELVTATAPNDECHRIDGGLPCLSLRFSPDG